MESLPDASYPVQPVSSHIDEISNSENSYSFLRPAVIACLVMIASIVKHVFSEEGREKYILGYFSLPFLLEFLFGS